MCDMVVENHHDEMMAVCKDINVDRVYTGGGDFNTSGERVVRARTVRTGSSDLEFGGHLHVVTHHDTPLDA